MSIGNAKKDEKNLCTKRENIFIKEVIGCSITKYCPRIAIDPAFHMLNILVCNLVKATPFREETAYKNVLILITSTLIGAVWMAVV